MPDRDVVFAKVASIQKCLRRIKEVTGLKPDSLDEINVQDIFVLNLQRAVQSTIDLAAHVIASEALGIPDTVRDNFLRLEQAGIISKDLSKRMQAMVGFRNIAIHDYQAINVDVLKTILIQHLKDLEEFYTVITVYFNIAKQ